MNGTFNYNVVVSFVNACVLALYVTRWKPSLKQYIKVDVILGYVQPQSSVK